MTTFEKIKKALESFGFPMEPDVYNGTEKQYFTYNYADDYGNDYADDAPQTVINSVQVHFFLPRSRPFATMKNKIRNALFEAGFTFPEITIQIEDDEKTRHIIFECDIEEE
mgnify:CR=1 FL=1